MLIVGAGFAGISVAKSLSNRHIKNLHITLVNPSSHFEYHGNLYRVLTGRSPMEVCVPLAKIFKDKKITLEEDTIIDIDFARNIAFGQSKSKYRYDYLVLTLGSETKYFDLPGLKDLSFSLKSIVDAVRLKKHIHEVFDECARSNPADRVCDTHFIVVGGGLTGVEIAGELASYTRRVAKKHNLNEALITIDLITSSRRLVAKMPKEVSEVIFHRLHELGVNIYLDRPVMKEEIEEIFLRDMQIRSKTIIWAAGTRGNHFYEKLGLPINQGGQVLVDEFLRPAGWDLGKKLNNIYIAGDGASTKYTGMASTAVADGIFVAENIVRDLKKESLNRYQPKKPVYALPVGRDWAAVVTNGLKFYGALGWDLRQFVILRYFMSILPFEDALTAYREDGVMWETCPVCNKLQ